MTLSLLSYDLIIIFHFDSLIVYGNAVQTEGGREGVKQRICDRVRKLLLFLRLVAGMFR